MERYRAVKEWLLEAVFPRFCVGCGRMEGEWLCAPCLEKIELVSASYEQAATSYGLDGFVAVGYYHDRTLRRLVHELKYKNATSLLPCFVNILRRCSAFRSSPWPWAGLGRVAIQPLVGVPSRVRSRGFDQAEFFANIIREIWVPWAEPISLLTRRKKSLGRQSDLEPGPLRSANVRGAFELLSPVPPAVILVDDVVTTGATMAEAARLFRAAGAEKIYGIALAKGM